MNKNMSRIKVGVARGGPSSEYDISLKTGGEVLKYLPERYEGLDVLIDKSGQWHLSGFPQKPLEIFERVDVLFNALHGEFGEDGRVQQLFEGCNAPYTGSRILASALAMKKHLAREIFQQFGISVPKAMVFSADKFYGLDVADCAKKIFNSMSPPWVIKPASAGSSVGVSICSSFSELVRAMEKASAVGDVVLAEGYIKGREATCAVLEDFRGEKYYALPVVEIVPPLGKFFDYDVKYDGSTREICPAGFDGDTKRRLEQTARLAHQILGCRHYSRADFIVAKDGVYLLEVNTLPGLTSESLFPKAAAAAGLEFPQLLDHILKLALTKG